MLSATTGPEWSHRGLLCRPVAEAGVPPDFLWNLVASVTFMRLSLLKGERAASSSGAWQEIRVLGKWLKSALYAL